MKKTYLTLITNHYLTSNYLQLIRNINYDFEEIETITIEEIVNKTTIEIFSDILIIDNNFPFDTIEIKKSKLTKVIGIGNTVNFSEKINNVFKTLDTNSIDFSLVETLSDCIHLLSLEFHHYKSEILSKPLFQFISVNSTQKIELIKKEDIVYLEAEGRYTKIHLANGTQKMASRNIGEFQKVLDKEYFCRIHHKYIINLNNLKSISKSDGLYCEMINQKNVPISKRKLDDLLLILNRYS